jgi:hypothetical protein
MAECYMGNENCKENLQAVLHLCRGKGLALIQHRKAHPRKPKAERRVGSQRPHAVPKKETQGTIRFYSGVISEGWSVNDVHGR